MNGNARHWWLGTTAIVHRELLSLFVTPLAYVVATLFLLEQGWNFALLVRILNDPLAAPGPVMQFYFGGSFFIFWLPVTFLCAAISMRLIAEERKQGTLEALLTTALRPSQIVVGKFVGALMFYVALWLPTAIFYVLLRSAAVTPELGPVLSGYLGTFCVGATFLAIGLLASAVARSQLGAAVATFVVCSMMVMAGLLVDQVDTDVAKQALTFTSLLTMMQELAQGIVDTRWLWLHAAVTTWLLCAAGVAIDPRRTRERVVQLALLATALAHVVVLVGRHASRDDWTEGRVYTLSERAVTVLRELRKPVDVTVLVPTTIGGGRINPVAGELEEVLARMGKITPNLRVRVLDPDRERQEAQRLILDYGLGGRDLADGVVLIRAGQGSSLARAHVVPSELVTLASGPDVAATGPRVKEFRGEEVLLGKFIAVSERVHTTVCYTQGHGEPDFTSLEPFAGHARLRELLEQQYFSVRAADLAGVDGLSGCDVLMVAGPTGKLPAEHVATIEGWAAAGGDILLLTGAVILRGDAGLAPHGLEPLAARYGIHFGERIVLDPHATPGASVLFAFTLIDGWGDHPAVRSLLGRPVSFVFARELLLSGDAVALVSAGDDAWAEADVAGLTEGAALTRDEAVDRMGPIPIAASAERQGSRMIVIASDQMALNANLREDVVYDHARDLIVNAVAWLSHRESAFGVRPRPREHVKLVLLPEQLRRMTLVCLLGLPGFAVGLGTLVLWRRRR